MFGKSFLGVDLYIFDNVFSSCFLINFYAMSFEQFFLIKTDCYLYSRLQQNLTAVWGGFCCNGTCFVQFFWGGGASGQPNQ